MLSVVLHNAEETVQVGDIIRPIFIPSVSTCLTTDRAHYYEGHYEVKSVTPNMEYPLDGETRGFGTVAYIDVNQNLNSHARAAFPATPSMEGDRYYYVSHFIILERGPNYVDPANPVIELTDQEKEIASLKDLNKRQSERIEKLLQDVAHNSEVLTQKFYFLKDRYNWCDEANEVADEINGDLRGGLEIECNQEFEVEVNVRAVLETTITVMISARSHEAAQEAVMDDPSTYIENYQINDALNWNDWTDIEYELY